jgi:ubiquinone/menaquinone biosynthesis C-methylase UbiE
MSTCIAEVENAKQSSRAVWGATSAGTAHALYYTPGTFEFFETVREKRSNAELRTVLALIPFHEMAGRKVLEVGCGAGYDAWEFCRQGADYTGIDLAAENIDRAGRHLEPYGYLPRLREADAESLPFEDESFDVAFSNGVLHHTPRIERALDEVHRVLRPGGEFWMVVYHRHSIFYWLTLWLWAHVLRLGFLKRSFREQLARIEYTTSSELPLVNVYSRREVRRMLRAAGFDVTGLWVRKLERADLPAYRYLRRVLRWIPQGALDLAGRRWGWYIVAHARRS